MKSTQYKSREYRSEAILAKAYNDLQVIAETLLPRGYAIKIEEVDLQSENEFTPRYKYRARVTPDHDAPHFSVSSQTKPGAYAKVIELLVRKPVYPIV